MAWTLQEVKDKPLIDVATRCQAKNANFHRLDLYFDDHPFPSNISVDQNRAREQRKNRANKSLSARISSSLKSTSDCQSITSKAADFAFTPFRYPINQSKAIGYFQRKQSESGNFRQFLRPRVREGGYFAVYTFVTCDVLRIGSAHQLLSCKHHDCGTCHISLLTSRSRQGRPTEGIWRATKYICMLMALN